MTAQTADRLESDTDALGVWLCAVRRQSSDVRWSVVEGGVMNTDVARTWDWIGSVLLFAFAILIILAFAFL